MASERSESRDGYLLVKGLSATMVGAVFLLLRMFAISDYEWDSAFALADILSLEDVVGMVLGTLMADPVLGGAAIAVLWPAAIVTRIRMGRPTWDNAGNLAWLIIVTLFAVSLLLSFHMWWVLVLTLVIVAVVTFLLRAGAHGQDRWGAAVAHWYIAGTVVLITVIGLVFAAVLRVPWAPLERIETKKGPVVGYVMRVSPGYLDVLVEKGRDMIVVDTDEVTAREELDEAP
ncbi:hypothetical protein [Nocardia sp. NPDC058666]|uniref:hypothetical protein n=1 Tax=unclassified Nocardia TaxID=2637762 RepID=UPI00364D641D